MVYFKRLALAAVLAAVAHAAVIIDDFTVTTASYPAFTGFVQGTVGSQTITETGIPTGNTIGGRREGTLTATSLNTPGSDFVNYRIASSEANYGSTNGAVGNLALFYNGGGSLGADLSGDIGLRIVFTAFDRANGNDLPVTVTLNDGVDHSLTQTLTAPGAQQVFFTYGSFSGGAITLGSINSIRVLFDGNLSHEFNFNLLASETAPEPASFGLVAFVCALALVGHKRLGWMRKRSPV